MGQDKGNISASSTAPPKLFWEWGTAYDFFISLLVLHNPDRFGLRGAWARGVRSRLSNEPRLFMEEIQGVVKIPLLWLTSLPDPKDTKTMLAALADLTPVDLLEKLTLTAEMPDSVKSALRNVAVNKRWNEADFDEIKKNTHHNNAETEKEIRQTLEWWSKPTDFYTQCQTAFQVYYEVFFAEEEQRIQKALQIAVENGKKLAQKISFQDLIEELSQGIRFEERMMKSALVMIPSFWVSPLIIITRLDDERDVFVFGGRPPEDSLVPGEVVPDALFQSLKALADPTRLRILRYLAEEPLTPTELARRLRLRAPTVIHHLNTLRLAGLVHLTFESKGDRRYAARINRINALFKQLHVFLNQDAVN